MSRLLFCWEPYLRLIASLKFSAADEGLKNAFSAGFASLVTNDDLDVSLFKKKLSAFSDVSERLVDRFHVSLC